MARQYTAIKRKTEDAVEALINKFKGTKLSGVTFYKGFDFSQELKTPRLEILAPKAVPEVIADTVTGNWTVDLTVSIVSYYKDTNRATHEKRIGVIEDIFMRPDVADLINNLSSVTNYTVFSGVYGWMPGDGDDLTDGKEFKSSYSVRIKCAPRTFETI